MPTFDTTAIQPQVQRSECRAKRPQARQPFISVVVMGLIILSGCYATPLAAHGPRAPRAFDVTRHSGVWGATGIGDKIECPYGMHSLLISEPWYSNLLRLVTLGLMASYKVHVVCADASRPL